MALDRQAHSDFRTRLRAAAPLFVIVLTAVVAQACAIGWPLMYTDDYVYENASSGSFSRELNVFNVDLPAPNIALGWWASTGAAPVQRRFVRYASSLLISAEAHVFGYTAVPYHLVTLALHATSCCIAYAILLGWLNDRRKALLAALVPAAHPIGMGVIANMTWQPAAVTTILMVLSVWTWIRFRKTASVPIGALSVFLIFATMTSYEVGVVVPLLVLGGDWYFTAKAPFLEKPSGAEGVRVLNPAWKARIAVLALFPVYAVLYKTSRAGVVYSEVGHLRPLQYVFRTLRVDGANYIFKTILLFDPHDAGGYWLYNKLGEVAAWAILLAFLGGLLWWARKKPIALLGILAWAILLAPPYLTRSTVHALSYPMLRQVYVPLFALPIIIGAGLERVTLSAKHWAILGALIGLECAQSLATAAWFPLLKARNDATVQFTHAVGDSDPSKPIVLLNDRRRCSYNPRFDWPTRDVLRPFPLTKKGKLELRRVGDDTLDLFAPGGFDLPLEVYQPMPRLDDFGPGVGYVTHRPPELVLKGEQYVEGAHLTVTSRTPQEIRGIRMKFDRPLDAYVFIDVVTCDKDVERVDVSKLPGAAGS